MQRSRSGHQVLGVGPLLRRDGAIGRGRKAAQDVARGGVHRVDDRGTGEQHRGDHPQHEAHRLVQRPLGAEKREHAHGAGAKAKQQQDRHDHRNLHAGNQRPSVAPGRAPHYRLEHAATGLAVAQTVTGYRLVEPGQADTFTTAAAAMIAAAGQPVDVVRVDA